MSFETLPVVELVGVIAHPYDLAVATARTCYSAKGIVKVEDVSATEKARDLRDRIAESTRAAGHLTTRQHAHFVFAIDKVSRHFLWSFLHAHPYYNSEQVSQRYVKVAAGNYTVPLLAHKHREIYVGALHQQMQDYHQLIELCLPEVEKRYFDIFPSRKSTRDKYLPGLMKRAYEVARYVLGVATHAYLYHTVSALTLMRYHRLCQYFEVSEETRVVVQMMVDAVKKSDPDFDKEIGDELPLEETPEYRMMQEFAGGVKNASLFTQEFDAQLDGKISKLIDYKVNAEATLAQAVRSVLGVTKDAMSDAKAIELALDPAQNAHFSDTLNVGTLSKIGRTLFHAHYSFAKKISHTADSQDQRHRMVPGSRPLLSRHYTGKPDYIVPLVIAGSDALGEFYAASMARSFKAINDLVSDGVALDTALYLLPNAFPVRFEESGDLLDLHHKWKARSCYTAQEEIFFATLDELEQVRSVHPKIAEHILAPCYLRSRAGVKPYCPEGERYCGIPVWRQDFSAYRQRQL